MSKLEFSMNTPYFPLEGKEEALRIPAETLETLALAPFEGKRTVPAGEKKRAIVFWGPPGSGKTKQGNALFQQTEDVSSFVTVCYDEYGALHSIPAYKEKNDVLVQEWEQELRAQQPSVDKLASIFQQRLDLYQNYRADSHRIRSLTLNEGLHRNHNLLIDITAAGPGAGKMIDILKSNGYEVELWGQLASAAVAEDRVNMRGIKVVEPEEVYTKRIGAYDSLPALMGKADKARIFLNDRNQSEPVEVITTEHGHKIWTSRTAQAAFQQIAEKDKAYFAAHKEDVVFTKTDALKAAVDKCVAALQALPTLRDIGRGRSSMGR